MRENKRRCNHNRVEPGLSWLDEENFLLNIKSEAEREALKSSLGGKQTFSLLEIGQCFKVLFHPRLNKCLLERISPSQLLLGGGDITVLSFSKNKKVSLSSVKIRVIICQLIYIFISGMLTCCQCVRHDMQLIKLSSVAVDCLFTFTRA